MHSKQKQNLQVLVINPWAVNNDSYYANGFINSLSKKTKVDFATNFYFNCLGEDNYHIYHIFFKYSENMAKGFFRKAVRLAEYVLAYIKIIKLIRNKEYDIIHIHWLLVYKIDYFFIFYMKKHCKKIILTAHNIIPHVNGLEYVDDLKKIYELFDVILLHGEELKKEFRDFFPDLEKKVRIQYHGVYFNQPISYDASLIDTNLSKKLEEYKIVLIMFGAMFFNKGTDRLIKIWLENFVESNALLIVAGKKEKSFAELDEYKSEIEKTDNIVFIDSFLDDNTLNYLITQSSCILIPYRHASMSGVIFTAAEFRKCVLCTKSGVLAEYLDNNDSFICDNNEESIRSKIKHILSDVSPSELVEKGDNLYEDINRKYSWDKIIDQQVMKIYYEKD